MARLNDRWIVSPHGPLVRIAAGIWSAEGSITMPLGLFPRRMTVLSLANGGSAVWSCIPLVDSEMAKVDALGPVRVLIVPNAGHRLDLKAWHNRYPDAQIICPPGAREAVAEAAPVTATDDIIRDPAIRFTVVEGFKAEEFALTVTHGDGATLILNDILARVSQPRGPGAQLMARLFGFGVDRPRTSRLVRRMYVSNGAAVARQFRAWAAIPDLKRVIVSHVDVIRDPRAALDRAAADFD